MWYFIISILFIGIGFSIITLETDKLDKFQKAFISTICICIGTICLPAFHRQRNVYGHTRRWRQSGEDGLRATRHEHG